MEGIVTIFVILDLSQGHLAVDLLSNFDRVGCHLLDHLLGEAVSATLGYNDWNAIKRVIPDEIAFLCVFLHDGEFVPFVEVSLDTLIDFFINLSTGTGAVCVLNHNPNRYLYIF